MLLRTCWVTIASGMLSVILQYPTFRCEANFKKEEFRKTFEALQSSTSDVDQQTAVVELLTRVIGENRTAYFEIVVQSNSKAWKDETVTIEPARNPALAVRITGTSGTTAAFGAQWYLRSYCNAHFSWDGNRVSCRTTLPRPANSTTIHSIGRLRYYANICTYSYSHVWWDWSQWEPHIDWLALNGLNFILMPVGQEYFWHKVYRSMGLTEKELRGFFAGPAFLAWNQMGNLDGWGGPLSDAWLESQLQLLRQIVARISSLGMIPIFGALAGHVPQGIARLFPKANLTQSGWGGFNSTAQLSPTDHLISAIQSSYINEILQEFPHVSHAYNADPFNEMAPSSYDAGFVRALANGIYTSLVTADPQAIWVLQGWFLFSDGEWIRTNASEAFLRAVPLGRMIVLDLYAEAVPVYARTGSFYGQPYIWCMLHNGGGNDGLWGAVDRVNVGIADALVFPGSSLVGTGLTMEGIFQNYPVYQFMLDRSWSSALLQKNDWIKQYAHQRYGTSNENIFKAWTNLWDTVYTNCIYPQCMANYYAILTDLPAIGLGQQRWYNLTTLCDSWLTFATERRYIPSNSFYDHDLVDLSRQLLVDILPIAYNDAMQAYREKNVTNFLANSDQLLELIQDLDAVLNSHTDFLLGPWIQGALKATSSDAEADLFRFNMKNQITLWGPNGNILDYASKHWSGLVRDYYLKRWELFVRSLLLDLIGVESYDQAKFNEAVFAKVEKPFCQSRLNYNVQPEQDLDDMMTLLMSKYYQPFCTK